jgi:hypothetical protein
MKRKLELALGRLHASFYTSFFTIIVESGAFATLWGIVYLSTLATNHWTRDAFSQPYYYVIVSSSPQFEKKVLCPQIIPSLSLQAITRMLIVLKMAQNKAWCRDIVSAAHEGVLDWQVTSTRSVRLEDGSELNNMKLSDSSSGSANASTI